MAIKPTTFSRPFSQKRRFEHHASSKLYALFCAATRLAVQLISKLATPYFIEMEHKIMIILIIIVIMIIHAQNAHLLSDQYDVVRIDYGINRPSINAIMMITIFQRSLRPLHYGSLIGY